MNMIDDGEAVRPAVANDRTELETLRQRVDLTYRMGAQRACVEAIEKLYAYFDRTAVAMLLCFTMLDCI